MSGWAFTSNYSNHGEGFQTLVPVVELIFKRFAAMRKMKQIKKTLVVLLVLIIGVPIGELVREEISYLLVSRTVSRAHSQINAFMTKEEVRALAGEPDSTRQSELREFWDWSAGNHQGPLWEILGLAPVKGHQNLSVGFDSENRVIGIWGGVN